MMDKRPTQLIIVADDKTKEYANYLRQLISVNDDTEEEVIGITDGSVDAAVWSENDYNNNQATISSKTHILFIGDNKTSSSEIKNMVIKYNEYGMKYGWLGKRGMMLVDDERLNKEEYNSFISYCSSYKQYFDKLAYKDDKEGIEEKDETDIVDVQVNNTEIQKLDESRFLRKIKKASAAIAEKVLEPAVQYADAAVKGALNEIEALAVQKKIKDQQYRALTIIYYFDGLKEFLEG